MTKQEFLQEVAVVLNEDEDAVTPQTKVEELGGWDSTGMLGLIAFLDGDLDVQVDVDKLRSCKTMQDLIDLCGDKVQ